jgi:hypothetical protein
MQSVLTAFDVNAHSELLCIKDIVNLPDEHI